MHCPDDPAPCRQALFFCCAVVEYCGCDFFLPPSCGIADMLCCDRSVRPPV